MEFLMVGFLTELCLYVTEFPYETYHETGS